MRQLILIPLILAISTGCSDDGGKPQVDPGGSSTQEATDSQRPVAPARLFADSLASSKASWDDLRARLDPGPRGDQWQSEAVAERSEDALKYLLGEILAERPENLTGLMGGRFTTACAIVPTEWAAVGPLGDLSVREGNGSGSFVAEEVLGLFTDLLQPWQRTTARIMVHCLQVKPLGDAIWQTTLRIRIGGITKETTRPNESLQRDVTLTMNWRFARRFLLLGIESSHLQETRLKAPIYQEITRASLAGTSIGGAANLLGAVEHTRRMDVQVAASAVALGMHGIGVGDLNGDGLEDLYVGRHSGRPNHYLLAQASGGFVDAPPVTGPIFLRTPQVFLCVISTGTVRGI